MERQQVFWYCPMGSVKSNPWGRNHTGFPHKLHRHFHADLSQRMFLPEIIFEEFVPVDDREPAAHNSSARFRQVFAPVPSPQKLRDAFRFYNHGVDNSTAEAKRKVEPKKDSTS
jgi:hypothetical protein